MSASAQFRGRAAFGDEIARMISLAFDNEVVLTDDRVIVWATYVSALPKANRRSLGLLLGTQRVMGNSYLSSPKINNLIVYFGYPEGIGQLVPPLSLLPIANR